MSPKNFINIGKLLGERAEQEKKVSDQMSAYIPELRADYAIECWDKQRETAIATRQTALDSMSAKERIAYLRSLNS